MPTRRLEDRIRELCARALYQNASEWKATLQELQLAIQQHSLRLSNLTSAATIRPQASPAPGAAEHLAAAFIRTETNS
jgi:hypothetical protein